MGNFSDKKEQSLTTVLDQVFPIDLPAESAPQFVVEAYARSGNTFLVVALRASWPSLNVLSHIHDVDYIAKADGSIPVVSLAREPLEAIASTAVHLSTYPNRAKESEDLHTLIGKYGTMLSAAAKNKNVFIVPFEALTSDINKVLSILELKYNLGAREVYKTNSELLQLTQEVSSTTFGESGRFLKSGNVPREKSPMYYEVLDRLSMPEYAEKIAELTKLYDSLLIPYYRDNK